MVNDATRKCVVEIGTNDNQEDSMLMNKCAIDKGLFRAQALKKYFETIKKNPASSKTGVFMKPDRNKVDNIKDANYEKLNEKGYAEVETIVNDGDVIIGMVNPKQTENDDEKPYKDNSTIYKSLAPGAIDKVITGFNNDGYPIIKIRVCSERIPTIGDKFSCYDMNTEILTDSGWKFFKDLLKTDLVAALNDNRCLMYEKPTEIMKTYYNGTMYNIETPDVNLCVTPNHAMYVDDGTGYKLQRADSIGKQHRKYCNHIESNYISDNSEYFDLSENKKIVYEDWIEFYSVYMMNYCKFENSKLVMKIKKYSTNDLEKFLIKYNFSYNMFDVDGFDQFEISDQHILSKLKSYNSYFPEWLFLLSKNNSKLLCQSMLNTGRFKKDGCCGEIETLNKQYVDNIQILCVHAGIISKIVTTVNNNDDTVYKICMNENDDENFVQNDKWIDYNGFVYCCTVSSGIICVRRNGIVTFSGNSRAAQKGTVGFKPHRADLPFTVYGLIPDIIINPNCIPKRMTIGQLIECLLAKNCAIKGVYGDATPFMGVDLHKINEELIAAGFEEWGNDTMYNGMTGQIMPVKIFIGPTYYQRLKQMVNDKAHSRASGPTQMLTRQPTEGRTKDGGLRFGEMERDGICAHGAAQTQKERMVDNSDIYTIHVCDLCGLMAHKVPEKKHYICRSCNNTTKISKISVPYAFKLLIQELRTISILGRIRTSKSITTPRN